MKAGSRTPIRGRLLASVAGTAVILFGAQPAVVAAAGDEVLVQDLLKRIEERDATIVDLVNRVQQLEQRLDAAGSTLGGAAAAPTAATGAAAAVGPAAVAKSAPTAYAEAPAKTLASPETPVAPAADTGGADTGSPPAPGSFAVDPEDAERALERTLVQAGALLLPFGAIDVEPGLTYVRRETTTPFLAETNGFLQVATATVRENELTGSLDLRAGLPWGFQFELGVPYVYEEQSQVLLDTKQKASTSGLGDVTVGVAKEFLRERGWRPDLIGRVTWSSDTGREEDNIILGSGFNSITGSLTALKRQDPLAFVASGFYRSSFEQDDIDQGDEFGFVLGTVLAASPDTSLSLSLQQTFANELEVGGRSLAGTDEVSSVLVVGASSVLGRGVLLSVNAGVGLTDDAPDYFVGVSLPIRFNLPVR